MSEHIAPLRKSFTAKHALIKLNVEVLNNVSFNIAFLVELLVATWDVASVHCVDPRFEFLGLVYFGILTMRQAVYNLVKFRKTHACRILHFTRIQPEGIIALTANLVF